MEQTVKSKPEAIRRSGRNNVALLVLLYMLQGVPMGLVMGSIPFFLQNKLSYTQQGIFSIAAYPYALKLFWSPVIDACYSKAVGRRKSWIIPIQLMAGLLMFKISNDIDVVFEQPEPPIYTITAWFLCLTMLLSTQDIAVDGWALALLSKPIRGWASTCQTVGLNSGFFLSFTVFLALNSADFCNKYLRSEPLPEGLISLSTYMKMWALVFLIVTFFLAFFKSERPTFREEDRASCKGNGQTVWSDSMKNPLSASTGTQSPTMFTEGDDSSDDDMRSNNQQEEQEEGRSFHGSKTESEDDDKDITISSVFWQIWKVVSLPNMQTLLIVLLIYKVGFIAADTVAALKLIEKGFKKEDLALFVLIEFPFQILFAVLSGKWASGRAPLSTFMIGFRLRLLISALGALAIYFFPTDGITTTYYLIVLGITLATSLSGTIQLVSQGAFFTYISDPSIGGTYLTLLNTFSNFGGTWPKFFVFFFVDFFTVKQCIGGDEESARIGNCLSKEKADECAALGGACVIERDGFYPVATFCFLAGVSLYFFLQWRFVPLQKLSRSAWKVRPANSH